MKITARYLFIICILAAFLTGCGGEETTIVGIWKVTVSEIGGKNISDGKSYFYFKEDGTVDTRSAPGVFRDGTYTDDKENHKIVLTSGASTSTYTYQLTPDQLTMSGMLQNNMELNITAVPVSKVPVTRAEEAHLTNPGMPTGSYSPQDSALIDTLRNGGEQPQ